MEQHNWILRTALLVFLSVQLSKSHPVRTASVQDASQQVSTVLNSHHLRQKRDDDDEDNLPEIVPEILKIVGSALAGNASALIDNSVSLLPEGVSDGIAGALSILVNVVNNARPTTLPPKTTPEPQTTAATAAAAAVKDVTATPSTKTTDEDEEDYEEDKTTTSSDLRTNSSSVKPTSISSPSEESASILSQQLSTTLVPLDAAFNNLSSQTPPLPVIVTSTVAALVVVTAEPDPEENSINPGTLDLDNKASWITLIGNGTLSNGVVDDIDTDNKANWASLIPPPSAVELQPISTEESTQTKAPTSVLSLVSGQKVTQNEEPHHQKQPEILPEPVLGSSSLPVVTTTTTTSTTTTTTAAPIRLGQLGNNMSADDLAMLIAASILKLNKEHGPFLPKIRDNSKAPSYNILSPSSNVLVDESTTTTTTIATTTPNAEPMYLGSLRDKLVALLQSSSSQNDKSSSSSSSTNSESLANDFASQLLKVIREHSSSSSKGSEAVAVDRVNDNEKNPLLTNNIIGSVKKTNATLNNGQPLYGNYASAFAHGSVLNNVAALPAPEQTGPIVTPDNSAAAASAVSTQEPVTVDPVTTTTEDEDDDEDEESNE